MKKLLLATTALTLSAGVAAADVSLSGDARMGLVYDGKDVRLTSRARVQFTMSGETDGGLAFGASFRANDAGAAAGNTRMTAGTVFISGDFGKLEFGDVDGAALAATGDLYFRSLTGLGDPNEMTYLSRLDDFAVDLTDDFGVDFGIPGRRTAALYTYTIDGFSVFVGLGQNQVFRENTNFAISTPSDERGIVRGLHASIGAKYTIDGFTIAAGYEQFTARANSDFGTIFTTLNGDERRRFSATHTTISAEYAMDGVKVKAFYGQAGGDLGRLLRNARFKDGVLDQVDGKRGLRNNQFGAAVEGTFDAVTVSAFAKRDFFNLTSAGVGMSYDLGGGASVRAGITNTGTNKRIGITRSRTQADLGLAFTF